MGKSFYTVDESLPGSTEVVMDYRGPGFLAIVWFGSFPHPPSPVSKLEGRPAWERETTCWREMGRGGGGGEGRSPIIRWLASLFLYNTLKTDVLYFFSNKFSAIADDGMPQLDLRTSWAYNTKVCRVAVDPAVDQLPCIVLAPHEF